MLSNLFSKEKEFSCFVCGSTDQLGSKKTPHGGICEHCINELEKRDVSVKETKYLTAEQSIALCKNDLSAIELIELFEINNPPLALKPDEKCFYVGTASGGKIKTLTTGYKGAHKGVSIRIMKGVSYHTGGSKGQAVREQVLETSAPGTFIMTGNRFVLQTPQYGFDLAGDKLQSIELRPDGFAIYAKNKMHIVITHDVKKIALIMRLLTAATEELDKQKAIEEAAKPQKTQTKKQSRRETQDNISGADEIRKYKQLYDEGIITEEQFEKKKQQILGL